MIRHYLISAFRHIRRDGVYSVINFSGLLTGMTCCILATLYIISENTYDRFHEQADRIYRITTTARIGNTTVPVISPGRLGPALVRDVVGIEQMVRIKTRNDPIVVQRGIDRFTEAGLSFADPSLFEVFDFTLASGEPSGALRLPNSLILSDELAKKYYGDQDPVGQMLLLNGADTYRITGVFDPPAGPSHLRFGLLASMATIQGKDFLLESWAPGGANPYVLLRPGYTVEELEAYLEKRLPDYMGLFAENNSVRFEPLTDIYLYSDWPADVIEQRGNITYVMLFSAAAVLILLMACINYMNLSTAGTMRRAREIGFRKVAGAHRGQLVRQFLGESVLLSLLALGAAVLSVELLLPYFNQMIGHQIHTSYTGDWYVLPICLCIALLVGIGAGSYPAFVLSRLNPYAALNKSISGQWRGSFLRKSLIVVEFSIAMVLGCCTLVLWQQLEYVRTADLGFDKDQMVVIKPTDEVRFQTEYVAIKETLAALPGVSGVTTATFPGRRGVLISSHRIEGQEGRKIPWTANFRVDHDFLDVMGMELIAGRNFDPEMKSDIDKAVLVNEAAVRDFGWGSPEEALGKWVVRPPTRTKDGGTDWMTYHVVGVVADFRSWSARRRTDPILMYLHREATPFNNILVRIHPSVSVPDVLPDLEKAWYTFAPNQPFEYAFLDESIDGFYQNELRLGNALSIFVTLAIGIACLGILCLSAFMTARRTREIGLRKVLGASVSDIIKLLTTEFVKPVLLAVLAAVPIAYIVIDTWLQAFAVHIDMGFGVFVIVGSVMLAMAILAVGGQAFRAAQTNPVETLRYE